MESSLISIIIPVYNVEKYLNRCIDSVINQKYENLEIILVDDGSPDNCPAICDEYSQKDNRIKVIHKTNGGLSDARNVGLSVATGDFVTFLDSDDYFLPTFSDACEVVNKNDTMNALCFGIDKNIYQHINYYIGACMKFFKLSFLKENDIKFINGIYHEDIPFSLEILINTNKIICYDNTFYYYDQSNNTSITHSVNEEKYFKRIRDIFYSINTINDKYNNILWSKSFLKYLSRSCYDALKLTRYIHNKELREKIIVILKNNKILFKYPRRFSDWLMKCFMSIFGIKNLLNTIEKL